MTKSEMRVSLDQAMAAQRRLRDALNLPEETFALSAFIGMVSDEIEQMRAAGASDAETARILAEATGTSISEHDVARHYAPPDRRTRG